MLIYLFIYCAPSHPVTALSGVPAVTAVNSRTVQQERISTAQRERKRRLDNPEYVQPERISTAQRKRKCRADNPEYVQHERLATAERERQRRADNECQNINDLIS
jgi:hypothetical protein